MNGCELTKLYAGERHAQKAMAFEKICRGWTLGTKSFKQSLLRSEGLRQEGSLDGLQLEGQELQEANDLQWEHQLERMLSVLHKDDREILPDKKSAQWKVWIANVLKRNTAATNSGIYSKHYEMTHFPYATCADLKLLFWCFGIYLKLYNSVEMLFVFTCLSVGRSFNIASSTF